MRIRDYSGDIEEMMEDPCASLPPCVRPTPIGKSYLLCGRRNTRFPLQCLVGPHWPGIVLTYSLIGAPSAFFFYLMASTHNPELAFVMFLSTLVVLGSFTYAACSDPGIVFRDEDKKSRSGSGAPEDEEALLEGYSGARYMQCDACDMLRPERSRHCYTCGVCVDELDHHCPWIGKCIGRRTLMAFYIFITSLCVHYLLVVVVMGWWMVSERGEAELWRIAALLPDAFKVPAMLVLKVVFHRDTDRQSH